MKTLLSAILVSVVAYGACGGGIDFAYRQARLSGALAHIPVHVVDDDGKNVDDAEVNLFMGMNFRPKGYNITGTTGADGMFVAEGTTCGDEVVIDVKKQGYYPSSRKLCFAAKGTEHKVKDGKWQPFGMHQRIVLRRIVRPAGLVACNRLFDIVHTNAWLGFDMEKMDFVHPAGTGELADFEIKADWDGLPAWESRLCRAEIRFGKPQTGGCYFVNLMESEFQYAYVANVNQAFSEKSIRIVDRDGDPHTTRILFGQERSLVTRTRSALDGKGSVKSANYGCIRQFEVGPSRRGVVLLRLAYVFNPVANDPNLESVK